MKKLFVFCFLLVSGISFAQEGSQDEVFSYYFEKDAISALKSTQTVGSKLWGKYELKDAPENEVRRAAGEYLIVDATGIYLEKNRLLSISREEVRENSKYRVSKGWLHGVVENDSIPCALDGEMYFFLTPVKTYLFEAEVGQQSLVQITDARYCIFSKEDNGFYSGVIFSFTHSGVMLNDIVFSKKDPNNIDDIEKKQVKKENGNDFSTYILSPTLEEWNNFIFKSCFEVYDTYTVVNEE